MLITDVEQEGDLAELQCGRVWMGDSPMLCWVSFVEPGRDAKRDAAEFVAAVRGLPPHRQRVVYRRAFLGELDCEDVLSEVRAQQQVEALIPDSRSLCEFQDECLAYRDRFPRDFDVSQDQRDGVNYFPLGFWPWVLACYRATQTSS